MKRSLFVASAFFLALGCGRQRQPNVAPGEERVFAKIRVAEAGTGVASRPKEDEVSTEELMRRNMVRQLEKLFQDAKSGDDRLDALDKTVKQIAKHPEIRGPELVPYVARCLTDPDPDQRIYGIRARAAISPKDALSDIKLVLRDPDPKVRQAAVEALGFLPDPLPLDPLFAHLGNEREAIVQQAAMLLFASRATEAEVPRVFDLVQGLDMKAVAPAIELARKFPASATPHADRLAYFLDRNDADLRMQVAKLLGEWGVRTSAVTSGLVRALNDSEVSVRKAAFTALKSLSNRDFGYDPEAAPEARQEALALWRAWAKQSSGDGKPEDHPESAPSSR